MDEMGAAQLGRNDPPSVDCCSFARLPFVRLPAGSSRSCRQLPINSNIVPLIIICSFSIVVIILHNAYFSVPTSSMHSNPTTTTNQAPAQPPLRRRVDRLTTPPSQGSPHFQSRRMQWRLFVCQLGQWLCHGTERVSDEPVFFVFILLPLFFVLVLTAPL